RGLEVVQGRALLWRLLDLRRLAVSELLEMLVVPGCQRVERLENAIDEVPGGRRQSPLIAEPAVRVARMELWIPGRQVDGELDPVEVEFATLQHRRHASLLRNHAILRVELPSGDRVNLALLAPRLSITDFLESVSLLLGRESVAAVADRGQAHVELAVGLGDLDLFVRLVHREAGHGENMAVLLAHREARVVDRERRDQLQVALHHAPVSRQRGPAQLGDGRLGHAGGERARYPDSVLVLTHVDHGGAASGVVVVLTGGYHSILGMSVSGSHCDLSAFHQAPVVTEHGTEAE